MGTSQHRDRSSALAESPVEVPEEKEEDDRDSEETIPHVVAEAAQLATYLLS
jgi:hypothetical protein